MIAERPRSPAQLKTDVENCERELSEARRENAQARTNRQRLMAAGESVTQCNFEISRTDKLIANLTERAEDTREAIKFASARDIQTEHEKDYRKIFKAVNDAAADAGKLDQLIAEFGTGLAALAQSKASADAALQMAGIQPLADHLTHAHVLNIADMGLYVATGGKFGKPHGLDSIDQLRESGRAKLAKAASEYQELTLRNARRLLHIEVQ